MNIITKVMGSLAICSMMLFTTNCKKEDTKKTISSLDAKGIFKIHCMGCHGEWGKGDGTLGVKMETKPTDIKSSDFKYGSDINSVVNSISVGFTGSGMPGYKEILNKDEIKALAKFVLYGNNGHK